ncbi:MAG: hypothetical protein WAO91_05375 [Candidatus Nitrosotenuis sp.]
MRKDIDSIDKNGFSVRFFEELVKEHERAKDLADKQKALKLKHSQSVLQ